MKAGAVLGWSSLLCLTAAVNGVVTYAVVRHSGTPVVAPIAELADEPGRVRLEADEPGEVTFSGNLPHVEGAWDRDWAESDQPSEAPAELVVTDARPLLPEPEIEYFPEPPSRPVIALLENQQAGGSSITADHPPTPQPLEMPPDAAPLPSPRNADAVRAIIESHLPNATPEERDIWFEQYQHLPPDMVRDILRLRQRFREVNEPDHAGSPLGFEATELPAPLPPPPPPEEQPGKEQTATGDADAFAVGLDVTIDALLQARDVVLNNIANAQTPGFKRARIVFEDLSYEPANPPEESHQGVGCLIGVGSHVATIQMDHSQGRLRETGRVLDVAIGGPGFFQVSADEQLRFTRCGVLSVTENGMLGVLAGGKVRPLLPEISLPPETVSIQIAADGTVTAQPAGAESAQSVGRIQLVMVLDPAELQPQGNNLFAGTSRSGLPSITTPGTEGAGTLRQGSLEKSNVALKVERRELRRLERQLTDLQRALALDELIDAQPTTDSIVSRDGPKIAQRPPQPPEILPAALETVELATQPLPGK